MNRANGTGRTKGRAWLSWQTSMVLAVSMAAFVILSWRTTLPCNRHRELDTLAMIGRPQAYPLRFIANTYDEGVTQVSARNFARDGFLHTHLLANRGGFPLASLYDSGQTQCDSPTPPKNLVRYEFGRGKAIEMPSLNNDCVYAHFPPLADWVFGIMATLGLDQYGDYRIFAEALNCLSLVVLYFWLRREVSEWAAAVAVVLTATLPAFVHWSDALFFHPFQFLFLFTALLTLSQYLERGRVRWLGCTWALFFAQSLLTYQLLPCFAAMMVGLVLAEERRPLKSRIRLLCGLFSAPLLATAFHFLLRISHMGAGYTWDNIRRTVHDRTVVGLSYFDFVRLLLRVREYLLRFDLIALSVLLVIVVHLATRFPLRRRLILLISSLLGGVGFWVVFPATALLHYWMTYRHQMPFIIILLALVTEAGRTALKERTRPASRIGAHPIAAYGLALACCCPLGWTAYRNLLDVGKGFELARLRTPTAEANLATDYLDLAQWSSDFGRRGDERFLLLFDGRRADALKNPYLRYEFPIGISSHDELWWLEAVSIRSLQLLLEDATLALFREHCALSFFDGVSFRSVNDQASMSIASFVPTPQETPAPHYRWLRYSLESPVHARAVRVSCANLPTKVPLHELEVH